MDQPSDLNDHQSAHSELMLRSYRQLVGEDLIAGGTDAAQRLFEAPFFLASHNTAADPVLTYGNRTALELFEMSWTDFTSTPSRFTAQEPLRDERARLLEAVRTKGFIDDYSGIRISSSGKRFEIQQATVWNLLGPQGETIGQAATFSSWIPL